MIIIINEQDASALRDLIYYELDRRDKVTDTLPSKEGNILDQIVTSGWWKSLQATLKSQAGDIIKDTSLDYPIEDNTIITTNMREQLKNAAIELYKAKRGYQ